MAKSIDWFYQRKHCTTCQKAAKWRGENGIEASEFVDAAKVRYPAATALKLLDGIDTIVAAKGQRTATLELKDTDDAAILALIMGPTGKLRAPTSRAGHTLLVGFNVEAWASMLA